MTAKIEPSSGLSYGWILGEDNWNTGMDANLVKIGAGLRIDVIDFVNSPYVTTDGARFIVIEGIDDFSGHDNSLAVRVDGEWLFYPLPDGSILYNQDYGQHFKFTSGSYNLLVDLSSYLTSSTAESTYGTIADAKTEYLTLAVSDETTALTTGNGKITFRMPYAFTVSEVRGGLTVTQTSGSILTVDINENGTTILSTKLTIDNTEKTSTTASTAPVISSTYLADDAEITIDIDQIGDGTAKGLKITLIGIRA